MYLPLAYHFIQTRNIMTGEYKFLIGQIVTDGPDGQQKAKVSERQIVGDRYFYKVSYTYVSFLKRQKITSGWLAEHRLCAFEFENKH